MVQGRKTAVVTGGNSGIGFETAKSMTRLGWRVVITGRDAAKLRQAVAAIRESSGGEADYRIGDFASFASVRALAADLLEESRIDVLLNNAGIALSRRTLTPDGNETVLQVNHLAPFLLTRLLLDKIKAGAPARIVNVSSRSYRFIRDPGFDDFQFSRYFGAAKAYARTKLYNILFTRELARHLHGTGVTANALHPGIIASRIGMDGDFHGLLKLMVQARQPFKSPPETGSKVACFVATAPELDGVTGQYFSTRLRPERLTNLARDDRVARQLWDLSRQIVILT